MEQRDGLVRAGACRGPGSPAQHRKPQSPDLGEGGDPQITPHFPVHEPGAASSPRQQQKAKHFSKALPSPCPLAWLGTLPAPQGLMAVTPNTEAELPQPQAQPPLGVIPVLPGQEASTVSQGPLGSPHLTANHRHVQPSAWGGEGHGRHPLGTPSAVPVPFPAGADITSFPQRSRSPPGAGRHPPPPTWPRGDTATRSPSRPQSRDVPCPCHGSLARLCHIQPRAGKGRLPSPPTRDAQPEASRARSTAHGSQALTDRQTDVGRLQPFLLLQHGRTRGAWTQTKYFLKSCST